MRLCLLHLRLLAGGVESAQDDACRLQAQRSGECCPLSSVGSLTVEDPKLPTDSPHRLLGASCHAGDAAVRQIGGDEHDQAWGLSRWSAQRTAIGPSRVLRVGDHGPRPPKGRTRSIRCSGLASVSERGDHHGRQETRPPSPGPCVDPRGATRVPRIPNDSAPAPGESLNLDVSDAE